MNAPASPPGAELFSASYALARRKFLDAAAGPGRTLVTHELDLKGAAGETLAVDAVHEGDPDAPSLLVTISGVHGVEGHCGSAVQTGLLRRARPLPAGVAVLHVHAINPYGFSHSRRVTQENVDLNRNFVDFSRPLPVNAGYDEIHDLLLPASWPPPAEAEHGLQAYRAAHGERGLQRAVSLGQYTHADGMFYGGKAPTWSQRIFRRLLAQHAARRQRLASIDLHTGLGPYGLGERIFACPYDPVTLARATHWWGALTSVETGSSTSVPLTGPIQTAFAQEAPGAEHTHLCLEYGTFPLDQMLAALRAEHWARRSAPADAARVDEARRELKRFFYPDADEWKQAVWQQGEQVFDQAVTGLVEAAPPV